MPSGVYKRTKPWTDKQRETSRKNGLKFGFKKGEGFWTGKKRPDMSIRLTGRKLSKITRNKISKSGIGLHTGSNNGLWKGGISKDKDYHRKMNKKWVIKNRSYKNWLNLQRRISRINADGNHTFEQWETLLARYNWTCPCCHKKEPEIKLTEDHIIPLSKGGSDNIENIQPLCKSCNSRKHTKIIKYVKDL